MLATRLLAGAGALVGLTGCEHETASSLPPLPAHAAVAALSEPEFSVHHVKAEGQLGPGRGTLIVDLAAPKNGRLTEGGPLSVKASGPHLSFPEGVRTHLKAADLPVRLPIDVTDGALGPAEVELYYYWCEGGNTGSCRPERAKLYVELDLTGAAPGGEAHFTYRPRTL